MKEKNPTQATLNTHDLIDRLRDTFNQENMIFIIDDDEMKKIVVAWRNLFPVVEIRKYPDITYSIAQLLTLCWEQVKFDSSFDISKVAKMSGVNQLSCSIKFERLKNARLIFPDGTVPMQVEKLIEIDMQARLKSVMEGKK